MISFRRKSHSTLPYAMPFFLGRLSLLTLFIASSLTAEEHSDKAKSNPQFVSIFDGTTLHGWSVSAPEARKAWYVKDGIIVGEGDKGRSYLIYEGNKNIRDFEMTFLYRFPGEGNSGVNIRARNDPTGTRDYQAYHVDIGHLGIGGDVLGAWDFHTPGRKEHRCFRGEKLIINPDDTATLTQLSDAVTATDIKKHDWNHVHVTVRDNHFKFSINGKPSAEFTEHLASERRLSSGMIQLQLHDPGMIVHYKDLYLKILDGARPEN